MWEVSEYLLALLAKPGVSLLRDSHGATCVPKPNFDAAEGEDETHTKRHTAIQEPQCTISQPTRRTWNQTKSIETLTSERRLYIPRRSKSLPKRGMHGFGQQVGFASLLLRMQRITQKRFCFRVGLAYWGSHSQ